MSIFSVSGFKAFVVTLFVSAGVSVVWNGTFRGNAPGGIVGICEPGSVLSFQ